MILFIQIILGKYVKNTKKDLILDMNNRKKYEKLIVDKNLSIVISYQKDLKFIIISNKVFS